MPVIDSDQHLVEYRGMWEELAEPSMRHEAIRMVDDDLGYTRLLWNGESLGNCDVQSPGDTATIGERQRRFRDGLPTTLPYDENLPEDHWNPAARIARLDAIGIDEAMLFPNYGLLWERRLNSSLDAIRTNMGAWNRWCGMVASEGGGRLHPVAHLTLRDLDWLAAQLSALQADGVRLAMIAPALVDGKPLSHPDLDPVWSMFVDHGVTPVFHVADQPRPFDDAWYTDEEPQAIPTLESVFLWTAAALASTDLIVNGVFDRHPDLRLGIVELSAVWVPMFLLNLDGGVDFTSKLNGRRLDLKRKPSEYFFEHIRVSSLSYELPPRLIRQLQGRDILMCCSDFPHSEGTATPLEDYARDTNGSYAITPDEAAPLFHDNAAFLLGR